MKIIGLLLAIDDWDDNGSSWLNKFKEEIIKYFSEEDYFLIYPNMEILTYGEAVSSLLNSNVTYDDTIYKNTNKILVKFNSLDERIVKKLFVITNIKNGISDVDESLLELNNKSYTQLFMLGIKGDVKNFVYLNEIEDIYPILEGEMLNDEQ